MARFTVRMVLHDNATWEDYAALHAAMAQRNLVDVITADNGVVYRLPPAEYYGQGEVTIERAREIASEAADTVGRRYSVFVTEGGNRAWRGLDPV
ncbi:DUF2622 domain-containing protein [Variovorax sp. KBS0712]|uniref:DUF2622 domain-containing protein n=1 Tax=Variovorax sp. KBS0712 TaxID=2578111 RepID=UPI001118ED05|nr:DUF2622 domain-containing protein [Variovorax sp. KBS0712]TSD59068.1 DUF2622 domain-containing protein [Variovorax sp. KBS0712]